MCVCVAPVLTRFHGDIYLSEHIASLASDDSFHKLLQVEQGVSALPASGRWIEIDRQTDRQREIYIYIYRRKAREREREGERSQSVTLWSPALLAGEKSEALYDYIEECCDKREPLAKADPLFRFSVASISLSSRPSMYATEQSPER